MYGMVTMNTLPHIRVTNSQNAGRPGRCVSASSLPMTVDTKSIYSTEIRNRPPRTWRQIGHAMAYLFISNLGCIVYNALQFIFLLPLCFIPLASARSLYHAGIRLSEGTLATLLGTCFSSLLDSFHRTYSHVQFFCANGSHPRVSLSPSNKTVPVRSRWMRSVASRYGAGMGGCWASICPTSRF